MPHWEVVRARDLEPLDARDRRDFLIGWGVILGLAGVIAVATVIELA